MKRIYSIGKGKYIHLDTYGDMNEMTFAHKLLMFLFVIAISGMTAGAIIGIDITNPSVPTTTNTNVH